LPESESARITPAQAKAYATAAAGVLAVVAALIGAAVALQRRGRQPQAAGAGAGAAGGGSAEEQGALLRQLEQLVGTAPPKAAALTELGAEFKYRRRNEMGSASHQRVHQQWEANELHSDATVLGGGVDV
jgi:hypothetical protein